MLQASEDFLMKSMESSTESINDQQYNTSRQYLKNLCIKNLKVAKLRVKIVIFVLTAKYMPFLYC